MLSTRCIAAVAAPETHSRRAAPCCACVRPHRQLNAGRAAGLARSRPGGTRSATSVVVQASASDKNIVQTAASTPAFAVLVEAVGAAGLADALSGPGPFTVFAPTNDAFVAALGTLGLSKAELLGSPALSGILLHHVLQGKVMASAVTDGLQAPSLQGSALSFAVAGAGGVKVNGAAVTTADISCANGVIHVIDKVLLPPAPGVAAGVAADIASPSSFSARGYLDKDSAGQSNIFAVEPKVYSGSRAGEEAAGSSVFAVAASLVAALVLAAGAAALKDAGIGPPEETLTAYYEAFAGAAAPWRSS